MNNKLVEQCYELLKQVPEGKVTTYKILANKLGKKCYRLIGQFMAKNENAPLIPCHRVVKSNGEIGGYMGSLYLISQKIRLLKQEKVEIANNRIVNFSDKLYHF